MELQKCRHCGKLFEPKMKTSIYCSRECYSIHKNDYQKEKKKPKKSNGEKIIDISREAKAHRMSYGKYVAYMEQQKKKEEL